MPFAPRSAPAVAAFTARAGRPPGLGLVLVGDDPASTLYVTSKLKSAARDRTSGGPRTIAGDGIDRRAPGRRRSSESKRCARRHPRAVAAAGRRWDRTRNGASSMRSCPDKDVDGFHPINVGRLVQNRAGAGRLHACRNHRVAGAIEHPDRGRTSRRHRAERHRRQADGIAAAAPARHRDDLPFAHGGPAGSGPRGRHSRGGAGAAGVRHGGIRQARRDCRRRRHNARGRSSDDRAAVCGGLEAPRAFERRGSLVLGDVHPEVEQVAGALTPVPGGVGPLTIAMLLRNTVSAAIERAEGQEGSG